MKKEFIPYEQALALKELGFDEPCLAKYIKYDNDIVENYNQFNIYFIENLETTSLLKPLYQQAFRWFREKYELSYCIESFYTDEWFYFWKILGKDRNYSEIQDYNNNKYEEAELECLKKLIEIVKSYDK